MLGQLEALAGDVVQLLHGTVEHEEAVAKDQSGVVNWSWKAEVNPVFALINA